MKSQLFTLLLYSIVSTVVSILPSSILPGSMKLPRYFPSLELVAYAMETKGFAPEVALGAAPGAAPSPSVLALTQITEWYQTAVQSLPTLKKDQLIPNLRKALELNHLGQKYLNTWSAAALNFLALQH